MTDNSAKTHFELAGRMPTGKQRHWPATQKASADPASQDFVEGYDQGINRWVIQLPQLKLRSVVVKGCRWCIIGEVSPP